MLRETADFISHHQEGPLSPSEAVNGLLWQAVCESPDDGTLLAACRLLPAGVYDLLLSHLALIEREQYLGHDFGRWLYVRCVDSWWREGLRACVIVRGIEHSMPDEGGPARDEEAVVTCGLRKSRDRWVIAAWAQGWPRFGSAPTLTGRQRWKDGWSLGS